jgi:hypothetical protein
VAYASSLQYLNAKVVSPAFTKAEGYKFSGTSAAAGTLSSEIAADGPTCLRPGPSDKTDKAS